MKPRFFWVGLLALCCSAAVVQAQSRDASLDWATLAGMATYRTEANVVYKRASGTDLKLDVYWQRQNKPAKPTLLYIHGGGWVAGSKEGTTLLGLPYLAQGMNVVNVEYRLGPEALAPAAVEDCRCALRWVYANAEKYGFDLNRLVVSGHSAGGHLSLMTGMLTTAEGFDNECFEGRDKETKVAAIVNFFGITDVLDVLDGPHQQTYAVQWFGSLPNRIELAKKLSPLTYVRRGLPPIITIHGDADTVVPYAEGVRLHAALDQAGVPNQLVTIPAKGHGNFTKEQWVAAQDAIFDFLAKHGVLAKP